MSKLQPINKNQDFSKVLYYDINSEIEAFNKYRERIQGGFIHTSKMYYNLTERIFSPQYYVLASNANYRTALRNNYGYVYIIEGTHKGEVKYKIGKANNLNDRLKRFEVKIPFDIELFMSFLVKDPLKFENELHKKFKHKRIAGEWFDLDVNDFKSIISIGVDRETLDLREDMEREIKDEQKKKWMKDKDYIEYLETMLIFNGIKFNERGVE